MKLYAESSALLAWLLGEAAGEEIRAHFKAAEAVVSSELTLLECDRALRRRVALREMAEADAEELRGQLASVARGWHVQRLEHRILSRARQSFPIEPVRTLDALHLASALEAARGLQPLSFVSLDERVRRNAVGLGLRVLP